MKRVNADSINVDLKPLDSRQGDVAITATASLPADLQEVTPETGPTILQFGEATGHKHAFYEGNVRAYLPAGAPKDARPTHLRVVKKTALLKHDEHTEAPISPGIYSLPSQVEHGDDDEPRIVAD